MRIAKTKNEDAYISWLGRCINERRHKEQYKDLCEWLYYQNFYSILPNDDNRAEDGLKLRDNFGIEIDRPCSILEMIVALAERMDYDLFDIEKGSQTGKWFWLLIRNLRLDPVDIEAPDEVNSRNFEIIENLLERKYDRNGKGGLFPLQHSRQDQRKVEIWYQMQSYIQENFL